jgi:sugar O-acyltransferase (sialic acid O-acetyltransferase NeuD family)
MKSRDFILVGSGGFGREVLAWWENHYPEDNFCGFVDDYSNDKLTIGSINNHSINKNCEYVITIGEGISRVTVADKLMERGVFIGNFIAPHMLSASILNKSVGSIFLGGSISSNVSIGEFVLVQGFACIGHDVILSSGVTVGSHAFIGGGCEIGKNTTIHPHSCILPKLKIGSNVQIGAGAVVIKNVPDNVTVFGSPAKIICYR